MTHSSDRQAWLEARKSCVTASDVAAMLGESPYKTRDQLRMEKAGLAEGWTGDENSDISLELEPFVGLLARKRFGWNVQPHGELIVDTQQPLHACTPDFTMASPWGPSTVQVKVTRSLPRDRAPKTTRSGAPSSHAFRDGAPLHYQLQVQSEMACLGYPHGVLLVLHCAPLALRAYYIPRHEGVIARIRREIPNFWKEINALKSGKVRVA